jgi:hypothetical protein
MMNDGLVSPLLGTPGRRSWIGYASTKRHAAVGKAPQDRGDAARYGSPGRSEGANHARQEEELSVCAIDSLPVAVRNRALDRPIIAALIRHQRLGGFAQ